ncbi:glycoside hydrolase family 38 C-terminal domain-containing protein [Paenibacillus sp.]|uniref:glycoside hydrolase family 38 N-terminal domain-containing protein n=1 Tax=Paenibacillus sp. TaxID=58172 RepID=UPI002D2B7F10|nr:glycoside hydrolase family 38 C-terminal domain-containing protein [Paenibacillus sp.]HZG57784.1 glycoside hydrolase family 38 C-terminal domain-containing protein [Paenibacillus sp.]
MSNTPTKTIHLVSHTHWDREWYLPFEQFRYRLVGLLDRLLAHMEADPAYRFHLDGQTILLEDYLELRPEALGSLQRLAASGRLTIGPWYVLMDGFLVSAESFIRNMEEGHRVGSRIGPISKVGYMPDTFGHTAQMPQILAGLGLEYALIWRGLNGSPEEAPTEFEWEAPSGDRIKTIHLPYWYGYTSLMNWEADPQQAIERIERLVAQVGGHSRTGRVLLMNGFDHLEPQHDVARRIDAWNRSKPVPLEQTTLPAYAALVFGELAEPQVLRGEFRRTNHAKDGAINLILPNVLSSRVYLKQQNADAQRLLELAVEPLQAVSTLALGRSDPAFVRQAWRYVLQNHPHDSICGCSVDAVHDEMELRYAKAVQIGEQLCEETLQTLVREADGAWMAPGDTRVLVFNTLPHPREALAEFEIDCASTETVYRTVRIEERDGTVHYGEIIGDAPVCPISRYSGDYPLSRAAVRRMRVRARFRLPAFGYIVAAARPEEAPAQAALPLHAGAPYLDNGIVRIEIGSGGQIQWTDLKTGERTESLFSFEDSGDVGDGYVYSPPVRNRKAYTGAPVGVELLASGLGWSQLAVTHELAVPVSATADAKARSDETKPLRLRTVLTLLDGSRTLHLRTHVRNEMRDHRLRVLFPVRGKTAPVAAGAAFDCIARPDAAAQPSREAWIENEPTQHPFHRYLFAEAGERRLTVTAHGLHEYEWVGDVSDPSADGAIAVTLFRGVSHLAGSDRGMATKVRPGPGLETPGSQCLREMTFEYAVAWEPRDAATPPWQAANEAHMPALVATWAGAPTAGGRLAATASWIRLLEGGDAADVTAMRPLPDGDGMELRLVNVTEAEREAALELRFPAAEVWETALHGGKLRRVPVTEAADGAKQVRLRLQAKKIVTLSIAFS